MYYKLLCCSDRKNKHRITLERRYHVNVTVLSSIELACIFIGTGCQDKLFSALTRIGASNLRKCGLIPGKGKDFSHFVSVHTGCGTAQPPVPYVMARPQTG